MKATLLVLALVLVLHAESRMLLTLVADDICNKPTSQQTSQTLANVVVSGGLAFGGADASAVVDAATKCCDKLATALASANSYAFQIGQGQVFSQAASLAKTSSTYPKCAQDAFAVVTTSTSTTPTSASASGQGSASGTTFAQTGGSSSASIGSGGSQASSTGTSGATGRK